MSGKGLPRETQCTVSRECLTNSEELAAIFRALGHPARIAIVKQLASRDAACCGEIVNHLPLAQSTVSQHLQVLKEAGLLTCEQRGRNCNYLLNWEKLGQAEGCSREFWNRLNALRPEYSGEPATLVSETE